MKISDKKKLILAYLVTHMDTLDPSKTNSAKYTKLISAMNDKQFDEFMHLIKDGKFQIHLTMPNMVRNLEMTDLLTTAKNVEAKIFHRLWIEDPSTGNTFLTKHEYPVINIPIRRQTQFLEEKMSVPTTDNSIDLLTGQVTAESRSSSITQPEIQALHARGLNTTLAELLRIRGGDIAAYGEFKQQLEETGIASMEQIDPLSRTRSSVMVKVLLKGCHLNSNL